MLAMSLIWQPMDILKVDVLLHFPEMKQLVAKLVVTRVAAIDQEMVNFNKYK
jgi:hypothetical protein